MSSLGLALKSLNQLSLSKTVNVFRMYGILGNLSFWRYMRIYQQMPSIKDSNYSLLKQSKIQKQQQTMDLQKQQAITLEKERTYMIQGHRGGFKPDNVMSTF